jgi:hypothetical protein
MTLHLLGILAGGGLVAVLGCGKSDSGYFSSKMLSDRVEETTPEKVLTRISASNDLTIEMYYGEPLFGMNVIRINSNGSVEFYAGRGYKPNQILEPELKFRHGTFVISEDLKKQIWQLVREDRVVFLDAEYHANVDDGRMLFFKFTSGNECKHIVCDNHFPAKALALFEFIMNKVVLPHDTQVANAPLVEFAMVPNFQRCGIQENEP